MAPPEIANAFEQLSPDEQTLRMREAIQQGLGTTDISAEHRQAIEHFLGYFDALNDYDSQEPSDKRRNELLQRELVEFIENLGVRDPTATPEAAADVAAGTYAGAIGVPEGTVVGEGAEAVTALAPPFDRPSDTDTPPPEPPSRPVTYDRNGITGRSLVPPGGETGNYRILAVQVGTLRGGNSAHVQMVVVNPQGEIVRTFDMASGGSRTGSGYSGINSALPGLDDAANTQTVDYKIDWNDVRLNRGDRGFRYHDTNEPGFSFSLTNPSNLAELGGAGRNHFRIHPNNFGNDGSQGCLTFRDDNQAREFRDFMLSLLNSGARPEEVEVVSASWLASHRQQLVASADVSITDAHSASAPTYQRARAHGTPERGTSTA